MSKKDDSAQVPGLPPNNQKKIVFDNFDMNSQAQVIGGLMDIQQKLSQINAFTTFKVIIPPQKIDSDIVSLLNEIRLLLKSLTERVDHHA